MYLELKTAPAAEPITLADAKEHLRISNTAQDDYINALIDAAIDRVDGPHGLIRRALITQSWYLKFCDWPLNDKIHIPLPPLQSITAITYYDTDNVQQTLATSVYDVITPTNGQGVVSLAEGQSWPSLYDRPDAVSIDFIAGYGDAGSDLPSSVIHAIKLLIGDLYADRGDAIGQMHLQMQPGSRVRTPGEVSARNLLKRYEWPGAIA